MNPIDSNRNGMKRLDVATKRHRESSGLTGIVLYSASKAPDGILQPKQGVHEKATPRQATQTGT